MSKYVGLIIALGFTLTWLLKNFRGFFKKPGAPQEIPTGIRRANYLVVGVFLLVGPFILTIGAETLVKELWRENQWVAVQGFVSEHVEAGTYRGRLRYKARFHFQTTPETGQVDHEVLDETARENPPPVSEAVRVMYDPSNPDHAIIDNTWSRWLLPSVFISLGIFFLSFAGLAAYEIMKLQDLRNLSRPAPHVGPGQGRLVKIKRNWLLSIKNQPSYRLVVSYQDLSGRSHIASSEPIWELHPKSWANLEVEVPLYLDRRDPSRAWVRVHDYYANCR